jgi:magnesium transporter
MKQGNEAKRDTQTFSGWARHLLETSAQVPLEALGFLGSPHRYRRRAPPAGATPGELAVPESAPPPRIRVVTYARDRLEEHELADAGQLASFLGADHVTWIDLQSFGDEALLHRIRDILDIHPLAMADVVNVPQRPKTEAYGDRLLIVTRAVRLGEGGKIEFEQLSLVLGPDWVATFEERPGDAFDPVRTRIRSEGSKIREMGPDFLAYALLDAVVDQYFPVVEALGEILDQLEEEVMNQPSRATLARIHAVRRTLTNLHQLQWRQRDAVSTLIREDASPITPPVQVYLRDIHDHTFQILDVVETYREMSNGLIELYLSNSSHRLNETMKTLTVVASIFIPLTFLAGVYGMNFDYMPELRWRWGYPAVWSLMIVVALGLIGSGKLAAFLLRPRIDGMRRPAS